MKNNGYFHKSIPIHRIFPIFLITTTKSAVQSRNLTQQSSVAVRQVNRNKLPKGGSRHFTTTNQVNGAKHLHKKQSKSQQELSLSVPESPTLSQSPVYIGYPCLRLRTNMGPRIAFWGLIWVQFWSLFWVPFLGPVLGPLIFFVIVGAQNGAQKWNPKQGSKYDPNQDPKMQSGAPKLY